MVLNHGRLVDEYNLLISFEAASFARAYNVSSSQTDLLLYL